MSCLFVSAAALVLLASNQAVEKSVASSPGKALAHNTSADPNMGPNTFEVLSYQDICDPRSSNPCYKFLIIGADETPPPGFEKPFPDFNASDAGFSDGSAAFGFDCSLESNITTDWPINTQLLVRRNVFIPAGATNVRVMVSVDNDIVALFFNGTLIAENLVHEGCAIPGEATFSIDVPQEVNGRKLVQPGGNLVVYWLRDRGGGSFFDTRILADLPPPALNKALNDLAEIVERRLPRVPVANVTVECSSGGGAPPITIKYQVEATGEAGMITLVPQRTGSTGTGDFFLAGDFFLDGTFMASIQADRNSTASVRTQAFVQRLSPSFDPGIESLGSVLSSSPVVEPLINCIGERISTVFEPMPGEPREACENRYKTECEYNCTLGTDVLDLAIGIGAVLTSTGPQVLADGLLGVLGLFKNHRDDAKCKNQCPSGCKTKCEKQPPGK
jgi:hypothetical protein